MNLENKYLKDNLKSYFDKKKNQILNEKEIEYAEIDFWVLGTGDEEINPYMREFFSSWRNAISKALDQAIKKESINEEFLDILPQIIVSNMLGASLQYLIDEGSFDLDKYFLGVEKMILKLLEK
jgi:TetR/AcrR family transcriptional regulator